MHIEGPGLSVWGLRFSVGLKLLLLRIRCNVTRSPIRRSRARIRVERAAQYFPFLEDVRPVGHVSLRGSASTILMGHDPYPEPISK